MQAEFIQTVKAHNAKEATYSQRDFVEHFSTQESQDGLKDFLRRYSHKPLEFFHSSDDWQAFVAPAFQQVVAEYGAVPMLPEGIITPQSEDRNNIRKRFIAKSEAIEDYQEGESFQETYHEGYTAAQQLRKPGARIVETYETAKFLPLDLVQHSIRLTMNEFRAREWKHLMHALHVGTSNTFDMRATDKKGNALTAFSGWRDMFNNAYSAGAELITFADIKAARAAMLRRERDAALPTICLINASTEAELSDNVNVNSAWFLGSAATYWQTGGLPNIYGLAYVTIPDALFGYFSDDVSRKNSEFVTTNDAFLIANDGATIVRHTCEPLTTETWNVYERQQRALNLWECYDYSVFKYTNIHRIATYPNSLT